MGKLVKAGADARHFLSRFRSLIKMAELVDELSGLESEVSTLEKRKVAAEEKLSALIPKVDAEQTVLKGVMKVTEIEREKIVRIKEEAKRSAAAIISKADQSVSKQHDKDMASLKALQLQIREEQVSFGAWKKQAEGTKGKILRDTAELQKALDGLRAKLL